MFDKIKNVVSTGFNAIKSADIKQIGTYAGVGLALVGVTALTYMGLNANPDEMLDADEVDTEYADIQVETVTDEVKNED